MVWQDFLLVAWDWAVGLDTEKAGQCWGVVMSTRVNLLLGICFLACLPFFATTGDDPKREPQRQIDEPKKITQESAKKIREIFSNRDVWDKGLPPAIRWLPYWTQIEQPSVSLFRDKVLGNKPYKDETDAKAAVKILDKMISKPRRAGEPSLEKFDPEPADLVAREILYPPDGVKASVVQVSLIEVFGDDDSMRISGKASEEGIYPKGLTIKMVTEAFGVPERVTKQVHRREGEGRPVVLTLAHYAGGAIIYAESDWAAKSGLVDRIILDVPTISRVLFKAK